METPTLISAKHLLAEMARVFDESPDRWTLGGLARTADKVIVDPLDPGAFSFSAAGFIERAAAEELVDDATKTEAYDLFIGACWTLYNKRELAQLNDTLGREAMVACARFAIRDVEVAEEI